MITRAGTSLAALERFLSLGLGRPFSCLLGEIRCRGSEGCREGEASVDASSVGNDCLTRVLSVDVEERCRCGDFRESFLGACAPVCRRVELAFLGLSLPKWQFLSSGRLRIMFREFIA